MRYFVAVAEEGRLTRAARRLHVAQPALSHAIAQLESQVGVALLVRHSRGVSLTEAGEVFLEQARIALSATEAAERDARSHAPNAHGVIDFGFLGVAPGVDSPGPFEGFASAHPNIEIRFRELAFPYSPTKSWIGDVDVAVCHAPPADPDGWSVAATRGARPAGAEEASAPRARRTMRERCAG